MWRRALIVGTVLVVLLVGLSTAGAGVFAGGSLGVTDSGEGVDATAGVGVGITAAQEDPDADEAGDDDDGAEEEEADDEEDEEEGTDDEETDDADADEADADDGDSDDDDDESGDVDEDATETDGAVPVETGDDGDGDETAADGDSDGDGDGAGVPIPGGDAGDDVGVGTGDDAAGTSEADAEEGEEDEEGDGDSDGGGETGYEETEIDTSEPDDDDTGLIREHLPDWSPGAWTTGTLETLVDTTSRSYVFVVDRMVNPVLGTPYPVNDGASGVFGYPVDDPDIPASGQYAQLFDDFLLPYVMPLVGAFVGFVLLGALIGPPLALLGRGSARSIFVGVGALAFVLVLYWDFISVLHYLSDGVTQFFLPTGDELIEDYVDGATGPLAALLGIQLFGVTKALLFLLQQGIRWGLLFVAPFAMPFLLVGAYAGYFTTVKMISSFFIWQYYALLVMNWPTAFLLRIAFETDFTVMFEGLAGETAADGTDSGTIELVVALLDVVVTMGFWVAAFIIPFFIMGSFGLASLLGRGMFITSLGNGVGRLRASSGGGGGGGGGGDDDPPDPPGGGSPMAKATGRGRGSGSGSDLTANTRRLARYGGSGPDGSNASKAQARREAAAARVDGGWLSRKAANEESSVRSRSRSSRRLRSRSATSSGASGNRSDANSTTRSYERERGRGREREQLLSNESRTPSVEERRQAAREKIRAQRAKERERNAKTSEQTGMKKKAMMRKRA